MKIYFAGLSGSNYHIALQEADVRRCLLSYYYWLIDKRERRKINFSDIFIDSGAFSAWSQGIKINLYEYIDFVKEYLDKITVYSNLDVIGDANNTLKNQHEMQKSGLSPLPVFHINENYKCLDEYCKNYPYIALGGMVGKTRRQKDNFLHNCFTVIKKYFPIRIHGFALTDIELLKKYPFYSIDTTAWLQAVQYKNLTSKDLIRNKKKNILSEVMFNCQITLERLKLPILNMLKLEQDLTNLWKMRGINWND